MPVRSIEELTSEVRVEIESYLERLDSGFCAISRPLADDILDETRSHFCDALDPESTLEDVRAVVVELGEPDEYATAMCAEVTGRGRKVEAEGLASPAGRVLGMPYDLKAPTAENLRTRMWNPEDVRIFTPRLVGVGWSINFAALAVKLGIVRPDDEDVPFAGVSEGYIWAALMIPVGIALGLAVAVALFWPSLPELVAIHWGIDGQPDGWASPEWAILPLLAMAVVPAGYALWSSISNQSNASRVMTIAFSMMFVILGGTLVAVIIADTRGAEYGAWWPWIMITASFVIPFVMLVAFSRLGRAEEMRRDLEE